MKKILTSVQPVNNYTVIHPALDFWDGTAIVSVGCKWQENYSCLDYKGEEKSKEVAFTSIPYCIMSDGEKFRYNKQELANRSLFYSGKIELPEKSRWTYEDIDLFGKDKQSLSFPELFQLIGKEFEYYVDYIDTRYYALLACFVIYTHFYPLFFNAPILQFWGEMRTGKTKNLSLLEAMCFNPVNSANISSASVFRLTESRRATILFDESEDLMNSERSKEIRNMLLAGTGRSGETYRQEKGTDENFKTQAFKVFSPKVIANIAGVDMPALLSRIIRISTVATKNREKDNRCVELEDNKWQLIRNQLYRTCLSRHEEVVAARDELKGNEGAISGRTYYIWQGILVIAKLANADIFQQLVELAKENRDEIEAEIEDYNEEPQKMVNSLLKLPLETKQLYTNEELIEQLGIEFGILNSRELAVKLGKLGIKSKLRSYNKEYRRYYYIARDNIEKLKKVNPVEKVEKEPLPC